MTEANARKLRNRFYLAKQPLTEVMTFIETVAYSFRLFPCTCNPTLPFTHSEQCAYKTSQKLVKLLGID